MKVILYSCSSLWGGTDMIQIVNVQRVTCKGWGVGG
jgi:hypothetical protein